MKDGEEGPKVLDSRNTCTVSLALRLLCNGFGGFVQASCGLRGRFDEFCMEDFREVDALRSLEWKVRATSLMPEKLLLVRCMGPGTLSFIASRMPSKSAAKDQPEGE